MRFNSALLLDKHGCAVVRNECFVCTISCHSQETANDYGDDNSSEVIAGAYETRVPVDICHRRCGSRVPEVSRDK